MHVSAFKTTCTLYMDNLYCFLKDLSGSSGCYYPELGSGPGIVLSYLIIIFAQLYTIRGQVEPSAVVIL